MNKNDFDLEAIKAYRSEALNSQKIIRVGKEVEKSDDIEVLFKDLDFIDSTGSVNKYGILFFGKDIPDIYSGSTIRVSTNSNTREIKGCLYNQVNELFEFIQSDENLKVHEFSGLKKIQKEIFPDKALREVILNAVSHKEYGDPQIPIQVEINSMEMNIFNPGPLPIGWGVKKLKSKHKSLPRNQKILNAFWKCFYVDHKGDGFKNIIESCKAHGIFPPVFEPEEIGFTARLLFNPAEWLKENGFETEHHLKIIEYVLKNEKIGNSEVQAITGLGETQSTKYLNSLAPILEKVGKKGPGVKYVLKDDFYVVEK